MTAGSVLLTASLARILWPDSKSAPVIAALLGLMLFKRQDVVDVDV